MRKVICLFGASVFIISTALAQIPPTRTHMPDVPFFLRSMDFRSMQMAVFPAAAAGMIEDPYSDLAWNPAFVLRPAKTSIYLTFNDPIKASGMETAATLDYLNYYLYSTTERVTAYWVSNSSISDLNTTPLYNLAAIIPLSSRFTLSVMNRILFDYAPFRSLGSYDWRDSKYGDAPAQTEEPKRLSMDNDQQKMFGTQSQIILGYRLSEKIDLGLRWGLLTYQRDGDLRDSDRGIYPHSSFDHFQSETLGIKGRHLDAGIGLLWRLDEATRLGFHVGATWGKSEESSDLTDRTNDASENDLKPEYYRQYSNALTSLEKFPATGFRPALTLTFEREISESLRFRSFFSYSWMEADMEGDADSGYVSASDYTYNYFDTKTGRYHFRRAVAQSRSLEIFQGTGSEKWTEFKGFISLSYAPWKRWAVFGGLQIQRGLYDRTISETTVYALDSGTAFSLYLPGTDQYHHSYDKIYERKIKKDQWALTLPLGMKFEIAKGLYALLGTDLTLALNERQDRGDVLFLTKTTLRWENGRLLVRDEEINRAECYLSDSPKILTRNLGSRCGVVYEYNSVLTFHLRIEDNIAQTADWAFGFEVKW